MKTCMRATEGERKREGKRWERKTHGDFTAARSFDILINLTHRFNFIRHVCARRLRFFCQGLKDPKLNLHRSPIFFFCFQFFFRFTTRFGEWHSYIRGQIFALPIYVHIYMYVYICSHRRALMRIIWFPCKFKESVAHACIQRIIQFSRRKFSVAPSLLQYRASIFMRYRRVEKFRVSAGDAVVSRAAHVYTRSREWR